MDVIGKYEIVIWLIKDTSKGSKTKARLNQNGKRDNTQVIRRSRKQLPARCFDEYIYIEKVKKISLV